MSEKENEEANRAFRKLFSLERSLRIVCDIFLLLGIISLIVGIIVLIYYPHWTNDEKTFFLSVLGICAAGLLIVQCLARARILLLVGVGFLVSVLSGVSITLSILARVTTWRP
jgi:hypothetical protein